MSGARRFRRALLVVGALLLLLLIAALSAPWWFDARRVASLALAQADAATGLDWSFDGEPDLRWQPQPWLALPGLAARDAQGREVLRAERLELALPWATLRGESLRVDAITVTAPDVDLDAALDWWNAQPPGDDALPVLDGLTITNGRVRWADGRIEGLTLSTPRFAVGEPMHVVLSGRALPSIDEPSTGTPPAGSAPFDVRMDLKATPQAAPLRLESLQIVVSGTGPVPAVTAAGRLQFTPWQLALAGELASWPSAWPALPPPLSDSEAPITFTVAQSGASAMSAEASITLRREDARVDAAVVPDALLTWLDDDAAPALPPMRASAALPRVAIDGVVLEGVSVELGDEAEADVHDTDAASEPASEPAEPAETAR